MEGDTVEMKLLGGLVELLVKAAPESHSECTVDESGKTVLCAEPLKAVCGCPKLASLFYNKPVRALTGESSTPNPCNACAANKMVNGKQSTITW